MKIALTKCCFIALGMQINCGGIHVLCWCEYDVDFYGRSLPTYACLQDTVYGEDRRTNVCDNRLA